MKNEKNEKNEKKQKRCDHVSCADCKITCCKNCICAEVCAVFQQACICHSISGRNLGRYCLNYALTT
jgi:hypothetical protein